MWRGHADRCCETDLVKQELSCKSLDIVITSVSAVRFHSKLDLCECHFMLQVLNLACAQAAKSKGSWKWWKKDQIKSIISSCILKKKKNLKPDRSNVPKSLRLQIYQSLGPKAEH